MNKWFQSFKNFVQEAAVYYINNIQSVFYKWNCFSAFTLEDELPDYDLDSEDEAFLETMNKNRTKVGLNFRLPFN